METLSLFRHFSDIVWCTPGQVVFCEGEPGDYMYVVLEGEVDLIAGDRVLEAARAGAILGEMAIIDHRPRSASAIARTDSKLVRIDQKRFAFLVQETPFFATHVMKVMADRLRAMDLRLAA